MILDACQLITFGNGGHLSVITGLVDRVIITADRAQREVLKPPARDELASAIRDGLIRVEAIDLEVRGEAEALAAFDGRPAFRGRGEAEVLALAATRGYVVGSDEVAVRRVVSAELGPERSATSLDILIWAIRQGRFDLSAADRLLDELDVGPGIRRELERRELSLADLV
ncbi:MAG TPA: hypothetical protein VF212_17965 [Longimicrobiales bacterium]